LQVERDEAGAIKNYPVIHKKLTIELFQSGFKWNKMIT
jgi:hypothetical protein